MRLTRIRVENHNRLVNSEIEIREHLILVGPNDVGKSSLLRCLDFLLGASTAQLYNRISVEDFADVGVPFVVEAELGNLDTDDQAVFPDEVDVDPVTNGLTLTIRLTATVDANSTLNIDRSAPHSGTTRQLSRNQMERIGWKLLTANAASRDLREDRRSVVDDILQGVDLGAEKVDLESLIEQIQERIAGSTTLDLLRSELAGQLSKALPVRMGKDQLEFITAAMADSDVLADVRLRLNQDGTSKEITDQSDGLRALYALALYDLASTGTDMVAVDEPEIHLHPTSQRSLARLLKSGPNQKFLATHSPDIVSAFSSDSIVSVRSGGQLVQPTKGFLTEDEKMVVRWWVRDKLEPLTANRVLAVEGPSDRIILEQIADVTDQNLDRLGISVIETDGAGDMSAIIKLFGPTGFNVSMNLLIDEDARDDTAAKLNIGPTEMERNGVVVSDPDLEMEYIVALGVSAIWVAFESSGVFTKNQLSNCARNGPDNTPTASDIRNFIHKKKYKVLAAMAVAKNLDRSAAMRVTSVNRVLAKATDQ